MAGWQARAALMLLTLFVLQSGLRLGGMLPPFQQVGLRALATHMVDLAALSGMAILLLHAARRRWFLQLPLALGLGVTGMVLTAFDLWSLVAIMFHQRVPPLAAVPTFYCNASTIGSCIGPYPGIALAVAGVWLFWSGLIFFAADALAAINARLLRPFSFAGRKPRLPLMLVTLFLGLWGSVWLFAHRDMALREPLVGFLFRNTAEAQPRALIEIARPDYRVQPSANAKPRLLVLIAIDSLRADAVELAPGRPSRTPFLQSLAAGGKLHDFGPAVAICPDSYCGIIGLLSSSDWAVLQKGPPLTIADVLAANGYSSHYLLGGPHRKALNLTMLYGPNVATMLDDSSADSSGLLDDREQVRRLQKLTLPDAQRSFVFIHLMSAHTAGLRFDEGRPGSNISSNLRRPGAYEAYYDRGVAQSDRVLRQLFDSLEKRGLLGDALVVITADHGERVKGEVGHGGDIDLATALVPLLIYDGRGGTWPKPSKGIASQTDAAPSLLAAAGIDIPKQWRGSALQSGVTRTAAPVDSVRQSGLVGRADGEIVMVRCDLRRARLRVLAEYVSPSLSAAALAAYPSWARDQSRRKEAAKCLDQ